jgi:hypothetical protein
LLFFSAIWQIGEIWVVQKGGGVIATWKGLGLQPLSLLKTAAMHWVITLKDKRLGGRGVPNLLSCIQD